VLSAADHSFPLIIDRDFSSQIEELATNSEYQAWFSLVAEFPDAHSSCSFKVLNLYSSENKNLFTKSMAYIDGHSPSEESMPTGLSVH